ncbi:MAG: VF530 family protein [Halioglobus sp.]
MSKDQPNNPLHGITLELVVTKLVDRYGWDGLAQKIDINCFKSDPSIKSSLKFLRKTPWARTKVENLYVSTFGEQSPWGNSGSSVSQRTKH